MRAAAKRGEEPPAEVKKQMDIYRQIKASPDPAKQKALFQQLLDISADEFYAIGLSTPGNLYAVVKNNLHNVPVAWTAWTFPTPAATNTEQYYFGK